MKTNGVNDINLDDWKNPDYDVVDTSSLWNFPTKSKRYPSTDFYGLCIPDVFEQVMLRFSKSDDLAVDLFSGGGTSGLVAKAFGRHWLGIEINPETASKSQALLDAQQDSFHTMAKVSIANSASHTLPAVVQVDALHSGKVQADLVFLHPPYGPIVDYSGSEEGNLCKHELPEFYGAFECVALNAFAITKERGYACLIVGDIYKNGQLVPLSYRCMDKMLRTGWTLKAHIVKNIAGNEVGKGKNANLWRYRHLKNGTYDFSFENIFIFRKEA